MKDNNTASNSGKELVEIDLKRLFRAVWKRAWIVALVAVLSVAVTLGITAYVITPQYEASTMFYVNNNSLLGDSSISIDSGDITASKSLVDTYIVILKSRACLSDVIDYVGLSYTYDELKEMISAVAVNSTEIFEITVTSPDAAEAEQIANAIAYILPKRISSIVEGTSANIVDYAVQAPEPSSPSYPKNLVIGFLIGVAGSLIVLVLLELFDVTVRTEEDIEQCCSHPILAAVPDMLAPTKGGYYAYGKSRSKYAVSTNPQEKKAIIGKNISFAASEAYKLLRTKLQFSFVDEVNCPVIGVSSAMAGEGKSLSSVNLAYSLAQLDKKVLLIDCDMRRPSLAAKLSIRKTPGLSNYLTGQEGIEEILQRCADETQEGFHVIASGRNPPNPVELISSAKMEKMIAALREVYDYIILDLPPIGEVSDALVAAKLVDGILLVVRQNYCSTVALNSAVSQFEFIGTRILGLVVNCVTESSGRYGRQYYRRYSRYSYAASASKQTNNTLPKK